MPHNVRSRPTRASISFSLGAAVLAAAFGDPAAAHDFWLAPSAYWAKPQSPTPFSLLVGHGPARQRSPMPMRRIIRFVAFGPRNTRGDLRPRLRLGGASDGTFSFRAPGAYLLALQTDDDAETHLPAIRFNDYLKAEGLTPALQERARRRRTDADGSENYSRCAKSLVQVGPVQQGSNDHVTRPVGLTLEIVPQVNPYAIPRTSSLPVRILYLGRPLAGALVKMTHLENDAAPFEMHLTDRSGLATFPLPSAGSWLLNVIWTSPQPPSRETDFETVFSSLSFGFPSGGSAAASSLRGR